LSPAITPPIPRTQANSYRPPLKVDGITEAPEFGGKFNQVPRFCPLLPLPVYPLVLGSRSEFLRPLFPFRRSILNLAGDPSILSLLTPLLPSAYIHLPAPLSFSGHWALKASSPPTIVEGPYPRSDGHCALWPGTLEVSLGRTVLPTEIPPSPLSFP